MPSYKGHLLGGSLAFVVFLLTALTWYALPDHRQIPTLLLICLLAALWPDVDIKSKAQALFYKAFLVIDLLLIAEHYYKEAAFLGLFAMLPIVGKHRGWTHSLWAAFLLPIPLLFFPMFTSMDPVSSGIPYYLAALVGYLSHLLLDGKLF
ncbi:MAG: metal-dependent hydrolase [Candidatus Tectomicrobia bacterium]|nr:metal-dependent hydrolase [Candidatus Tectomicrobia bacterium]